MIYLPDTNAMIRLMKRDSAIVAQFRQYPPGSFGLSSIVAHELFFGAYKGQRTARSLSDIADLRFAIIAFDEHDAQCAGDIRANLSRSGLTIGPFDVLIAGQALARSLTLITHNVREFSRVPGLRIADWQI